MAIQRYDLNTDMCSNAEMLITMGGDYVLHADHIAEVERLRKALEKVSLILSGWTTDRLGIQGCALKDYVDATLEGK